ncbi:hypothetical protein, partial [Petrachloros mirabilis]
MSDNLAHWNAVCRPPKEALKPITGGRLKGKTDINPQWRLKIMTAHFGPCGFGWTLTVDKQWLETGADNQVAAFVNISLYVKVDGEWSEAIPGSGGAMFVENELKGPHVSDEAFKMATTDALSVAMKLIGVAGDIYEGQWDGSKYSTPGRPSGEEPPPKAPPKKPPAKPRGKPKPDEQPEGYDKIFTEGVKYIAKVTSATDADAMLKILNEYKHIGTSERDLKKALKDKTKLLGLEFDKERG